MGSIPAQGTKIPRASEQLSPHSTTRVHAPQRKILHDPTKPQCNQIQVKNSNVQLIETENTIECKQALF